MGVAGATSITLESLSMDGIVSQWTVPAYCIAIRSPSVSWATGDDLFCIRQRIADALNIRDNDMVEFRFDSTGETFRRRVSIKENLSSDVLIHDMFSLDMASDVSMSRYGDVVTFKSGKMLILPRQNIWAGMKVIEIRGSATLIFDGASRNNPLGPAGYGFYILDDNEARELVEGYGFGGFDRSNNEMEYEGLIEGLIWAMRLDLAGLTIIGDSELVINQMNGKYRVKNPKMRELYDKACKLLQSRSDLRLQFVQIERQRNEKADNLANRAIITRKNVVTVNWPNVNRIR